LKTRLQVVNHRYSNTEMSLHTAYLIDTKNGEIMKRVGKLLLQWMTNFHYDAIINVYFCTYFLCYLSLI
jgi:hypothetical protein